MSEQDFYANRWQDVREGAPVHHSVKFGKDVRLGQGVVIDNDCIIGDGVFIGHNSVIRSGVKIGKGSIIGHLVMIEADTEIGENVTIQSQCHITKNATIGDWVFIGPKAMCINTRRISHGREYRAILEGPIIGRAARVGAGSIIMPGAVIGNNAVLGAGAVLTSHKHIPQREIWFGNPAVYRGRVEREEILRT